MKVVFFGTPDFAAETLQGLLNAGISLVAVVSKPDKPRGRSRKLQATPVKALVQKVAPTVPLYQPVKASSPEFAATLEALEPDLFIVASYGEIISQRLLDIPKLACLNVHPSLLPRYRGASPIQRCLMNGDPMTGVCIMEMVKALDAGDVYKCLEVSIPEEMNCGELEALLCQKGIEALLDVIEDFREGRASATPQDPEKVVYAHKITPEDGRIDWAQPAKVIHDQVRSLSPQPGAWFDASIEGEEQRFKVKATRVHPDREGMPGETLQADKKHWIIACGQGALELLRVQPPGKREMEGTAFLRSGKQLLPLHIA